MLTVVLFISLVLASITGAEISSENAAVGHSLVAPEQDENLLVYEPFDYDVGPLAGRSGGVGMAGGWSDGDEPGHAFVYDQTTTRDPVDTGAGLLAWDGRVKNLPTLPAAPAARFVGLAAGGGDNFGGWRHLLASAAELAGVEGILWASVAWHQHDDHPDSHVAFALGTNPFENRGQAIKGTPDDHFGSAIGVGGGINSARVTPVIFEKGIVQELTTRNAPSVRVGQTNLLLMKFVFGSYDTVSVHVFGEDEKPSLSGFNSKSTSATGTIDEAALNVITFSQAGGRNAIDEIRIGRTFISVTRGTRDAPPPPPDTPDTPDTPAIEVSSPMENGVSQASGDDPEVVQVFILAGGNNIVGFGCAEDGHERVRGAIGSLRYLVNQDPANYGHLVDTDGKWRVRNDVKVWWRFNELDQPAATSSGDLRLGYAQKFRDTWFGPEFGFGWVAGGHFTKSPVLIIKAGWLSKSLHADFRPPSAVAARGGEVGKYYHALIEHVREVLANLGAEFPEFDGKGHRIAGVGLHLGLTDRSNEAIADHEANLVDLIDDLRADFDRPDLPVVIATLGLYPGESHSRLELQQLAVADPGKYPRFADTVRAIDTRPFKRDASVSPSRFNNNWNNNGESIFMIGSEMGSAMMELLEDR